MTREVELTTHRVLLVFEGEGRLHFDRESVEVTSGSLVFGFSGEQFFADPKSPMQYLYISFSGARADDLLRRFSVAAKNRVFTGYDGMIPLWHESLSRASALTVDLAAESMLLYTFSRLSASEAEYGGLVGQLVEISEEQFSDPALSVNTLAQMLGYNAKYISHIFKEKMGITLQEYICKKKIEASLDLLKYQKNTITQIAMMLNYASVQSFGKAFRKVMGCSPTEYQKTHGLEMSNEDGDPGK
jgi:AraC-like DNA-binding protein